MNIDIINAIIIVIILNICLPKSMPKRVLFGLSENKCVANLTASRISLKKMRKTRIFQKDAYISIDFLEKELQIVKIKDAVKSNSNLSMVIKTNTGKDKIIYFENPEIIEENSILNELESFANSINNKSLPKVTLLDGYEAI